MTTVDLGESFTYGFKLFVALLGVVVLGGGGLVLGAALAGPELAGGVPDDLATPELIGGLVLGALGVAICGSGTFGLAYKLVADSIRRGSPSGSARPAARADDAPREPAQTTGPSRSVGPSPGEQSAREFGPTATVPGAADVPDRPADEPTTETDPGPAVDGQPDQADQRPESGSHERDPEPDSGDEGERERTAEEIAFGTGRGESGTRGDSTESPAEATGSKPESATAQAGGSAPEAADDPSGDLFADESPAVDASSRPDEPDPAAPDSGADEQAAWRFPDESAPANRGDAADGSPGGDADPRETDATESTDDGDASRTPRSDPLSDRSEDT